MKFEEEVKEIVKSSQKNYFNKIKEMEIISIFFFLSFLFCGTCYTFRVIFFTISSLKCGSCKKGAIPSADPEAAFLALRGTACIIVNDS